MSGVDVMFLAIYVGKCGPICLMVLFCNKCCICLPLVFVDLYPSSGQFAFRSVIMYTGIFLLKILMKSGIGMYCLAGG